MKHKWIEQVKYSEYMCVIKYMPQPLVYADISFIL